MHSDSPGAQVAQLVSSVYVFSLRHISCFPLPSPVKICTFVSFHSLLFFTQKIVCSLASCDSKLAQVIVIFWPRALTGACFRLTRAPDPFSLCRRGGDPQKGLEEKEKQGWNIHQVHRSISLSWGSITLIARVGFDKVVNFDLTCQPWPWGVIWWTKVMKCKMLHCFFEHHII